MARNTPYDDSSDDRLLATSEAGDNSAPLSITEISQALKRTVEDRFGYVRLRGELSGVKRAASGHLYLALKDEKAVSCVLGGPRTPQNCSREPKTKHFAATTLPTTIFSAIQ